jgi:hypothetical protein
MCRLVRSGVLNYLHPQTRVGLLEKTADLLQLTTTIRSGRKLNLLDALVLVIHTAHDEVGLGLKFI